MDRLFAPWRMEYILSGGETPGECIFCAFPARGPAHFREHLILVATPRAFAMMNKFPYANGHILIVPRHHASTPTALDPQDWAGVCELVQSSVGVLSEVLATESFNLGMNLGRTAGAGIEHHCHFHVVPRWSGDTNFMPVLAETKVISEHLESTYERLLPKMATLGEGPLG